MIHSQQTDCFKTSLFTEKAFVGDKNQPGEMVTQEHRNLLPHLFSIYFGCQDLFVLVVNGNSVSKLVLI